MSAPTRDLRAYRFSCVGDDCGRTIHVEVEDRPNQLVAKQVAMDVASARGWDVSILGTFCPLHKEGDVSGS